MSKNQKIIDAKIQNISEDEIKKYVNKRFEDVKNSNKIKNLVSFQAMNKYMIMAHNQEELKILGNIVASNKKIKLEEIFRQYKKHLKLSLETSPTTKKHSNVMMHIFGYFSKDFSQIEKKQFLKLLEQFTENKITIGKILSEINPLVYRFNNTYLASQTYFLLYSDPQPGNLFQMLREK